MLAGGVLRCTPSTMPQHSCPSRSSMCMGWARDLYAAAAPFSTGGVYVNYISAGDERVRAAYGPAKYDRLTRLKAAWDPINFWRLNQNIAPALAP